MITRLLGDKGFREYVKAPYKALKQYPDVRFGRVGLGDESVDAIAKDKLQKWV